MNWLKMCIAAGLLILLAGCAAQVRVMTDPSGGLVTVTETGQTAADGETIELDKGEYTLTADKEGFQESRADIIVTKDRDVIIPLYPAYADLTVATDPAGGSVTIDKTGRRLKDGETVSLAPGRYTLIARKDGYREKTVQVDVDGRTDRAVTVHLGTGHASLSVSSTPEGAMVAINGENRGQTPLTLDLAAGDYQVSVAKAGACPWSRQVSLLPGQPQTLAADLGCGNLTVVTRPAGGAIYLDGRKLGTGKVNPGQLQAGTYHFKGIKSIGPGLRLTGTRTVAVEDRGDRSVRLPLNQRQRLLAGQWLPEAEALQKEQARYEGQRAARPLVLNLSADEKSLAELSQNKKLDRQLQALLRVGDRLQITAGDKKWCLWKRHQEITPVFAAAVAAMAAGRPYDLPWQTEAPAATVTVSPGADLVPGLALALHRARTDQPLLDLTAAQLAGNRQQIERCDADGQITLVAVGGAKIEISGDRVDQFDNFLIARLPAGDRPATVSWQTPPDQLLAVSDHALPLADLSKNATLQVKEKQIVPLTRQGSVQALVRYSAGPDYNGWHRRVLDKSGPLAGQLDLTRDEIGPHDMAGNYQRTWVLTITVDGGQTQRQIDTTYQVGGRTKNFEKDTFLRRKEK